MPRLIAFLRAVNVGGHHSVTMGKLRDLFAALGFQGVETFIASGNVLFTAGTTRTQSLEETIADRLERSLGFEVAVFIRTEPEVAAIAGYRPFPAASMRSAAALNVGFLARPLGAAGVRALMAFKTEIDDFHVEGREVYWLCRKRQGESTFSNVRFERALGVQSTFRGLATITRLATKYSLRP